MNTEKVTWVHHWTDKTFSFKTTRNQSFRFVNGEFAMIGLMVDDKPLVRAYSIASANYEDELEFLSIKVPDGPLTSRLQHLKVGDEVKSYKDGQYVKGLVTEALVHPTEAVVDVYKSEKATLLKPGYLADWNKTNKTIKIKKADVKVQTAWINGRIILKHMKFSHIIKKLERHYDVRIKNNNKSLGEELITATFDIETIEQVFEAIKEIHPIEYKIKEKIITIN